MATTTARTRQDVDNMTARDRLWDSMGYTYGKKRENVGKDYAQAYSQADRQLLSRGMQRSSYGAQTLANINQQRNEALRDVDDAMIADYENRLMDIERQEKEDEKWERQFSYQKERDLIGDQQWQQTYNEQLRQFNENMAYQRERANVSDSQWQQTYDAARREFDAQMEWSREQFNQQQSNWQAEFDEGVRQFNVQNQPAAVASGGGGGGGYYGVGGGTSPSTTSSVKAASTPLEDIDRLMGVNTTDSLTDKVREWSLKNQPTYITKSKTSK